MKPQTGKRRPTDNQALASVAAVVIGRNEGDRLVRCLASLKGQMDQVVYVDSGSDDGSAEMARDAGAEVVELNMSIPFTAARARNAGVDHLTKRALAPEFIQFLDGDCVLQPDWVAEARSFLEDRSDVAVVCGRRRERFPQATLYNGLIDREWDTPVGQAEACGGDALFRYGSFQDMGGYNPDLIAGEEPELCLRLRRAGWKIWRLDAEMTLHDAEITRFGQWWQRARRAGHAYAEGASLHGSAPERHYVKQTRRALFWGGGVPLAACLGTILSPWAMMILLLWPLQVLRLKLRGHPLLESVFLSLSKLPETQGIVTFYVARLRGRKPHLIEYK